MRRLFAVIAAMSMVLALFSVAGAAGIRTGAYATTTANLNLRSGPSTSYRVYRVIPYGGRVWVYSGPYNSYWYKVSYSGTTGYVYGSYLSQGSSSTTSYSSRGQALANTAKRYLGYPYAKNGETGNTPSEGFSCVGFTQWVYRLNGIYIPENLWGQARSGWAVSRSNLRPGDIVLFQNTWWAGLSHAGIYYGNGWMINASTPSTGVKWDNIYNSYYINRWWGGRRLVN